MSPEDRLTPNQVVAWNLARARALRGWTQEQAAEQLAPFLGERWSKATYSAAERSIDGARIRQFTADDIHAFARAFDLPMTMFLAPPPWADQLGHAAGGETTSRADYVDRIFNLTDKARERLLSEIIEMSAATTRALRRWGDNFAAMVAERDAQVEALVAVRDEKVADTAEGES
jgi:transcriptional regulator with XRE-family HTH domain